MQQLPLGPALNKVRNKTYKQLSFTMDFDAKLKGCMSPMMWGYYGGKCSGICIEFDFDKLKFPKDAIKGPVSMSNILSEAWRFHLIWKQRKILKPL